MEEAPDVIKILCKLHETSVKGLEEHGYSDEEAFWYGFAVTCLYVWDPNAQVTVKLSEIFRLYLTIYCEKIDEKMNVEDEPAFLELLKGKYDQVRESVLETEDAYLSSQKLSEVVHGVKSNIIKQAFTASVLSFAYATVPMPFKLVEDV